ncbi:porin [Reyranella sp.]|uniref:porin n=1 Tax=Reyranella sp. TaxID=1929291 RepID=UPI003F6FAFD9
MKKLLLGSTALVVGGLMAAPAMAADPIKVGVGGYYTFYAIAGGIQSTYATNGTWAQYRGLQFQQEGEIHFIGQTKLDNGTSVGIHVELEGWNPAGATQFIDEAFLFAFGGWGRVEFGGRDPASYRMYYGTPSALIGFGAIQHNTNFAWANQSVISTNKAWFHATTTTNASQFQDGQGINYFTPRFQGLQIGVGYRPKTLVSSTGGGAALTTGPGNVAGACGYNNPTSAANCPTNDYTYQDMFDVGANYLNKFGDVTVALYGSFMYANFVPGNNPFAGAANMATGANLTSWKQWVVGAQFGFKGFTLGGAVGWDNNGLGSNYYTGQNNDTRFYTAGIMYETGPWQMSVNWVGSYNNNGNGSVGCATIAVAATLCTTPAGTGVPGVNSTAFGPGNNPANLSFGQESVNKWEIGVNYALGPGVKLTGGGLLYTASGPSAAVSGNSWGLLMGMDLRF